MFTFILLFLGCSGFAVSKTVTYNWDITWVTASPDGFARPVIGINGKWPCPAVEVDLHDRLVVNVYNKLGNESTSLHWHGLPQHGTAVMDGATGISQCPIPPGERFTYDFLVDQPGTYWYHSHNLGQFPDGLRGPIIVHDQNAPYADKVDGEIIFTMSDWYHEQMPTLLNTYQSRQNVESTNGLEPIPDTPLINDQQDAKVLLEPGKTYLLHIFNLGNFVGFAVLFDEHPFTVVSVDGTYTEITEVKDKNIRIATGQRWSFLFTAKPNRDKNYAIFVTEDINMFTPPLGYNPNATAWLVYDDQKPLPPPLEIYGFDFFDDMSLTPYDQQPLLDKVDHHIQLDASFANVSGIHRATINNVTYLTPKVPSLYTALTIDPEYASNPLVYGVNTNPIILQKDEVVEIILNNNHYNLHPWHLHGHQFQVVQRSDPNTGPFTGYGNLSSSPLRRDTIMANIQSHLVIRFKADNPGVWAFHCHIEWHVEAGFTVTLIEAPDQLQGKYHIPADHIRTCDKYPQLYEGNAAGNTKDPLNLDGSITEPSDDVHGALYTTSATTNNTTSAKENGLNSTTTSHTNTKQRQKKNEYYQGRRYPRQFR